MDDVARAELDALRVRAYGPDADIAGDVVAQQRLAELEEALRREHVGARAAGTAPTRDAESRGADTAAKRGDAVPTGAPHTTGTEETRAEEGPAEAAPTRRRWAPAALLAGVAALVVAVLAVGALWPDTPRENVAPLPAAQPASTPPVSELLERIEIEGPLGNSLAVPFAQSWPAFTDDEVDWAASLGERFGWELWVAGVSGESTRFCIVLERHGNTRVQCAGAAASARGLLRLELPNSEIAVARQLEGVDRIEFRWTADGAMTVTSFSGPPARSPRSTDP